MNVGSQTKKNNTYKLEGWHPEADVCEKLLYDISLHKKDYSCHELRRHHILVNASLQQTKIFGEKTVNFEVWHVTRYYSWLTMNNKTKMRKMEQIEQIPTCSLYC